MTTHAGGLSPAPGSPAAPRPQPAPAGPAAPSTPSAPAKRRAGGRTADRAARRAFRAPRAWPALIVAVVLAVAGVLAAIEIISTLVDRPSHVIAYERAVSWATTTTWRDAAAVAIAAAAVAIGLWLLLLGLLPGRSRLVPLHGEDPDLLVGVTRHGLRRSIAAAARGVDGVAGVRKVKLRRRKVIVRADTALQLGEGLDESVRAAVQDRVAELDPRPRRAVIVQIRRRKG